MHDSNGFCVRQVKTTSPKKYCVRPNSGIVPPRSTSDVIGNANLISIPASSVYMGLPDYYHSVTLDAVSNFLVTMQEQKEAPPDMQCKDKFLVQSVIVAEGTSAKDITGDMVLHILNFLQNIPVGCSFLQCLWLYLV